jgi:O-antigen ligase
MRISKLINIGLFNACFLSFLGYYAILLLIVISGMNVNNRAVTIPVRIFIVALLGTIYFSNPKLKFQKGLIYFFIFSFAYLTRILFEYLDPSSIFHIPEVEFFLYFMSFVFLPLFFVSQFELAHENYEQIFWSIVIGALIFALLSLFFYYSLVGSIAHIMLVSRNQMDIISPLIFSYGAVLGIGVSISYLITNKTKGFKKLIIYFVVILCFGPFLLGASRGSIITLVFPFIFYLLFAAGIKKKGKIIFAIICLSIIFSVTAENFSKGFINRISMTQERVESGTEIRLSLWGSCIQQFVENPVFGNSLNNERFNAFPHNILLEVLITTGIIGFVPFIFFLYIIFKKMKIIVETDSQYFWICFIFLQAFSTSMFSGSLYNSSWFALGSAFLIGFKVKNTTHCH